VALRLIHKDSKANENNRALSKMPFIHPHGPCKDSRLRRGGDQPYDVGEKLDKRIIPVP
jgi:hypothetical protein